MQYVLVRNLQHSVRSCVLNALCRWSLNAVSHSAFRASLRPCQCANAALLHLCLRRLSVETDVASERESFFMAAALKRKKEKLLCKLMKCHVIRG